MLVLKIVGIILLVLLVLLALLLILPIKVSLEYTGSLKIWVKFLLIKIKVYEDKEKVEKEEKTSEKDIKKETKKIKKKLDLKQIKIEDVLDLLGVAGTGMQRIFKALKFRNIVVIFPVQNDDVAKLGENYGNMQMYAHGVIASLKNFLDLKVKMLRLIPDFGGYYKGKMYIAFDVKAQLINILIVLIYVFMKIKDNRTFLVLTGSGKSNKK